MIGTPQAAPQAMIVAGLMSGTSADGVDVALCRIVPGAGERALPQVDVLGHRSFPYEATLRAAVLAAMDAEVISAAGLARLSWRLGEVYANAVRETARALTAQPELIACHGQTIYHQGTAAEYLGMPLRCTWQIGEASVLAERLRLPVVSDFRPADLAAGGQGAPLVPMLDFVLFQQPETHRILLNLGGIANVTVLPAGGDVHDVLAFDTGPANMVIDALMVKLTGRAYDCGGGVASRGGALPHIVDQLRRDPYFSAPPPKSCGREEFGAAYVERVLALCADAGKREVIATATALTVATVVDAVQRFCLPHLRDREGPANGSAEPAAFTESGWPIELLAAGGGAHNRTVMRGLGEALGAEGVQVGTTEAMGLAVEAKEAAAFALLGWLRWHGLPGNVPVATGASRPAVLGKVTLP